MKLETVIIETDNGPVTINKSDLTSDMKLFVNESDVIKIEDMKKDQLLAYSLEKGVVIPSDITKVQDIKEYLLSLENGESDK